MTSRPLAVVTGASSGIGLELARQFARKGFDLIVNAEDDELSAAADDLRTEGVDVAAAEVLDGGGASDHLPLLVDLRVRSGV